MAVPVYTSLSDICETMPRWEKSQGVDFECIEAGYHLVLFNCVHRSQKHVSNRLSEINFQVNIAPCGLWRNVFWKDPDQSPLPHNNACVSFSACLTGPAFTTSLLHFSSGVRKRPFWRKTGPFWGPWSTGKVSFWVKVNHLNATHPGTMIGGIFYASQPVWAIPELLRGPRVQSIIVTVYIWDIFGMSSGYLGDILGTIDPFVHWSIGPLVHWSIGLLVH